MKYRTLYRFILFVLLMVFFTNVIEVKAMNTGFSTEELPKEKRIEFLSKINISRFEDEGEKRGILCFDVNEQGMIVIGKEGAKEKEICVYTSQGEFLYGFSFTCTQTFGVEWDKRNINIYFIRSNVIISLDSDGKISDIKAVQDTIENNTYRNSLLYSTERIVGDTKYQIRNNMGIFNLIAASYSQIITIDTTGTERIVYDVNSSQLAKIILIVSIICVIVSVAVVIIVRHFIMLRNNK